MSTNSTKTELSTGGNDLKSFLDKDKTRLLSRTLYEKIKSEEMEETGDTLHILMAKSGKDRPTVTLTNPKDIKIYVKPHKYKFGVSKSGVSSVLSAEPVNSSVNNKLYW